MKALATNLVRHYEVRTIERDAEAGSRLKLLRRFQELLSGPPAPDEARTLLEQIRGFSDHGSAWFELQLALESTWALRKRDAEKQ